MANRDRSQGFGFMYVDIAKLLAQRDELDKTNGPLPTENTQTINFNKDPLVAVARTRAAATRPFAPAPDQGQDRKQAIHQIRENLDRLQTLHHKLHAMLEDLNSLTDADKKKS